MKQASQRTYYITVSVTTLDTDVVRLASQDLVSLGSSCVERPLKALLQRRPAISDEDLPADGNLTAEGCPSSIVVLQVFAPTTPLHFLLSPWRWICFFLLPLPPWSGLLVTAERLFSFPTGETSLRSICGRAHVSSISTMDDCCCLAVSAPQEKLRASSAPHSS